MKKNVFKCLAENLCKNKKRYITGVFYVLILLALITYKWLVPVWGALGFDALFCAISVIGCLEFFNMVKGVPLLQRALAVSFCASAVPFFTLCEMTDIINGYIPVALLFGVYAVAIVIASLVRFDNQKRNAMLLALGAMVYCGILVLVFSGINHLNENSAPVIMLMFFTVMLCDTFAYFFGSMLKRWLPLKLAPKISPNKTVIGGVGGLIGGVAAGVASYYLWFGMTKLFGEPFAYSVDMPAVVAFMLVGFVGAIAGQAGDLFESYIKRRCDVKDSGKILPGHGGVLDRFDSMLFTGTVVLVSFLIFTI